MSAALNFAFEEHLVRVVDRGGDPWFVGKDVCNALDIKNHNDALSGLDDDEKGVAITDPLSRSERGGGAQELVIISEAGVFRLVFRSRKPEAERFKRWLAHEVLPALRRTGRYALPGHASDADEAPALAADIALAQQPLGAKVEFLRWVQRGRGFEAAALLLPALGLPALPAAALPPAGTHANDALARILDYRPNHEDSVATLIDLAEAGDIEALETLDRAGVRPGDGGFWLTNEAIARILGGRAWINAMRSLPGAAPGGRHRIGGTQHRTTWFAAQHAP